MRSQRWGELGLAWGVDHEVSAPVDELPGPWEPLLWGDYIVDVFKADARGVEVTLHCYLPDRVHRQCIIYGHLRCVRHQKVQESRPAQRHSR